MVLEVELISANHPRQVQRLERCLVICLALDCLNGFTVLGGELAPNRTLAWDLTYQSVLSRNNLDSSAVHWLRRGEPYESPIASLLRDWKGPPISSSVLLEFPIGHGTHHGALLLIKFGETARYHLTFSTGNVPDIDEELDVVRFDEILQTVASWKQNDLRTPSSLNAITADCWGFLSIYDGRISRQLALARDDFILSDEKPGRILHILEPFVENLNMGAW
jgi:hypothetical protein